MELSEILLPDARYLCLAGAGVSMDPPSALPSARSIVSNVITACAPPDQAQIILNLAALRYEFVIEELKKEIDPDLCLLDYFDSIPTPNAIHWNLASLIRGGHDVITTNFDYFIERALIAQLDPTLKSQILPIITKVDFQANTEPKSILGLHEAGKFPIFKIHGSKKNDITGEITTDSLITTLKALGRDRSVEETFAIEPYKKPALLTLAQHRILLVLGYSGSDDFDIGPTLLELTSLHSIVWIDHLSQSPSSPDHFTMVSITSETPHTDRIAPHLFETLQTLHQRLHIPIYLVQGPTASVFQQFTQRILTSSKAVPAFIPYPGAASFTRNLAPVSPFIDYITSLYAHVTEKDKYILALNLLYGLNHYDAALSCAQVALQRISLTTEPFAHGTILNLIGLIYMSQGQLPQALDYFTQAEGIYKNTTKILMSLSGLHALFNNIGWIHFKQGNYAVALDYYQRALEKGSHLGGTDREREGLTLNNIGELYREQNKYDLALQNYSAALQCYQEAGYLPGKAITLSNMGLIYRQLKDYPQARTKYTEALHIDELLDNRAGQATRLNNLGTLALYQSQEEKVLDNKTFLDEAASYLDRAYQLATTLGNLEKQATYLSNLANLEVVRGNLAKAIEMTRTALNIQTKIGIPLDQMKSWNNLANMYARQKEFTLALSPLQEALVIATSLKNEKWMINLLNDLIELTHNLKKYPLSQQYLAQLAAIDRSRNDSKALYEHLLMEAHLAEKQSQFPQALAAYSELLPIVTATRPPTEKCELLTILGSLALRLSDFPRATQFYTDLLATAEDQNDLSKQCNAHWNLSRLAQQGNDIDNTFYHLDAAYGCANILKDLPFQGNIAAARGMLYGSLNETKKAISSFLTAREIFHKLQKTDDERQISSILKDLGYSEPSLPKK